MRHAYPLLVLSGLAFSCGGNGEFVRGAEPDWRSVSGRYRMTYQSLDWNEGITLGARPALICLDDNGLYAASRFPIWERNGSDWRLAGRQRLSGKWSGLVVGAFFSPIAPPFWGVRFQPHPTPRGSPVPGDPVLARTDRGFELRFSYGDLGSPDVMIFTQVDSPCGAADVIERTASNAASR